jgi:multicomponent Na+:H+ antiporter subunit B
MSSLVLKTTSRWLVPPMLVSSIWILLRGHDSPGGGFEGGLIAVAAYILDSYAEGATARARLRIAPEALLGIGLLLALVSASFGPVHGAAWMTGSWIEATFLGMHLTLGTPLLFDIGVFFIVIGSGLAVFLPLISEPWR